MQVLFLFLALVCPLANAHELSAEARQMLNHPFVQKTSHRMRRSLSAVEGRANQGDFYLNRMVQRALRELDRHGEVGLYRIEWETEYRGFLIRMVRNRDIGDHPEQVLVKWLDTFYQKVVSVIGVKACEALHLSDIWIMDVTIPIVFQPCTFNMDAVTGTRVDEYIRNFAEGAVYYGFASVLTWWAIEVPCVAGTSGIASLLCGAAAEAGEYIMGKDLGPPLATKIYSSSCN